ncbi:MAG: hypothetical protein WA793_03350 [Sphingorhabdus sp.]
MTNPLMQPAVLVAIGSMIVFMAGLMFVSVEEAFKGSPKKD